MRIERLLRDIHRARHMLKTGGGSPQDVAAYTAAMLGSTRRGGPDWNALERQGRRAAEIARRNAYGRKVAEDANRRWGEDDPFGRLTDDLDDAVIIDRSAERVREQARRALDALVFQERLLDGQRVARERWIADMRAQLQLAEVELERQRAASASGEGDAYLLEFAECRVDRAIRNVGVATERNPTLAKITADLDIIRAALDAITAQEQA